MFDCHLTETIANESIGIMKQLSPWVPRRPLEEIYKLYVWPHLDYGDTIYAISNKNSPSKNLAMMKVESVQYEAAIVVSGARPGTSRD